MDVLSEVLKVIRLDGALFFNAELTAPWCLTEPHGNEIAPGLSPGATHLVLYHYVLSGRLTARLPGDAPLMLSAGDVVIVPHGDPHILSSGPPEKPVDAVKTFEKNLSEGLKLTRFGGGGEVTRLVCGYLVCEPRLADVLLSGLPRIMTLHLADDTAGQWLANSIQYSVGEGNGKADGGDLVTAKLSEVMFVETLRRYINSLPAEQVGWLAGARDTVVGQALALLHREPAAEWTIESLSRRVGVSRTRLAERFKHFLDDSPMAYLAKWRLRLGAESLLSTESSIAEIAAAVGYGSESTFNRAFKREYRVPPAQFRRGKKRGLIASVEAKGDLCERSEK
jgi:AraC-like DNA-binding protein